MPPKPASGKGSHGGPSTPSSSKTPAKKLRRHDSNASTSTPRKSRQVSSRLEQKGSGEDTKSFLSPFGKGGFGGEACVAAYNGYTDRGRYRAAMTSFPALENAVVLKKAPASDATILEVLRDIPAEEWDEYFPEDEAPLKKYPQNSGVIDDEDAANDQVFNVKLAAAFGVVQMMRSFEAMPTMSHADKQIRQRGALKDFNRNFDLKLPEGVELGEITLPNFGPLEEHDEDPLEACNRSLQMARCLKEMNYATKWPWAARKAQPLAFFDVSSQVPFWMSPRSRPAPSANVSTRMVPKSFTIEWQKNKGPDALALLNKLDDKASTERFDVPTSVQKVASDPRVYDDDARWRDSVRRQFNCEVAEMQIDRLLLQAPVDTAPQSPMDKFYLYGSDEITKEWSDIKDMLDAHPLERLRFLVEMRALEPGEDLYESKLPAIQLDGMFGQMGNGDLIMMQPNEDGENVAEEEEPPTEGGTQELPSFSGLDTSNLDTLKDFPDRAAFLHHYNGLDINDPVQRLKWQRQTFQWLSRGITGKQHEKRNDANLPAGEREVLQEAYTEGHAHAVSQETTYEDEKLSARQYHEVTMAFSGTEKQRGPIISDAILVMGMKYDGEDTLKRRMYSCPMLPKVKRKFYEYQISGAADSLVKSFGTIPLDGAPPEHVNDPEIQAALGRMKTIPLHSHINADQTGLGKTIQELLAHAWMVEYSHERDSSGQRIYRPTLVNVPKSVIDQWVKEISRYWKNLEIAIAYGDSQSFPSNLEQRVVTATSMRDRFAKDGSRKPLPARFEKMLDQSNPDAARFIMPTTYDTFRSRCSWKVKTFAPAQSYDPPQYNEAGREVLQPRRLLSIVYQTGWVGVFRCVILDEGHRIRNYDTASNAIMEKLRADVYWVVTATPIVTWPLNFHGYAKIFWVNIEKVIDAAGEHVKLFLEQCLDKGFNAWDDIGQIHDKMDYRRLCALEPNLFWKLANTGNVTRLMDFFHLVSDQLVLHRSTATKLQRDRMGSVLDLATLSKGYTVQTFSLELRQMEKNEYQLHHIRGANSYDIVMNAAVMGSGNDSKRKPINPNAPIGPDKQGAKPIFPTAPLRDLAMLSTSVLVARFQEFVKGAGRKALVADVNSYRIRGYGATWFINATWRPGDAPIDTKRERMEFLSFGSPTLRLLLRTIISEVLPTLDSPKQRMRKLLVTEATVLSAWFYEIVLKYGLINAKVMHSDLTQKERTTLSNEFLDINSDLQVLVIMYDVSAQGLNLHSACHVAFVATAARNCALEVQGWGRILRLLQEHQVRIIRKIVENTHDLWLNARQADRGMLELATRARDPLVRKALIRALNEAQPHVKELKNSPDAKRIEKYMRAYDAQQAIAGVSSEGGEDTEEIARAPKRRRLRSPSRADDQPAEEADAEASDDEEEGEEERPVRRGEREDLRELMADFSLNVAELKKRLGSLTHEEQARFSFDDWLTWRMCQIDDAKVFTEKDLEDDAILERALRLLYLARIGRPNDLVLGRIHIDYDALPLEQKLAADRQKQHFAIDRDGRLKMRNLIDYGSVEGKKQGKKPLRTNTDVGQSAEVGESDDMIIDETRSGPMRRKGTAGLRRFGGEGEYEDIDRQIKEEDNDPSNRQQPPGRGLLDSDTDDDAPGSSAQHRRPALPPLPLTRLGSLFSFSVDPAPEHTTPPPAIGRRTSEDASPSPSDDETDPPSPAATPPKQWTAAEIKGMTRAQITAELDKQGVAWQKKQNKPALVSMLKQAVGVTD